MPGPSPCPEHSSHGAEPRPGQRGGVPESQQPQRFGAYSRRLLFWQLGCGSWAEPSIKNRTTQREREPFSRLTQQQQVAQQLL